MDLSEFKAAHSRIEHLAHHDPLTDLPNRALMMDRLKQAISLAERLTEQVGVLFLDLDHFKHINDSLGHVAGDELLQEVAKRLARLVRAGDTVARLGGDEFVLVLGGVRNIAGVIRVVTMVMDAIAQPFFVIGHAVQLTASVGLSLYPRDDIDGPTLLKKADNAMYHAKLGGRAAYRFFSQDMDVRAHERFQTETDLRAALKHGEFRVHYQPQVNSRSGRMVGVEALVRWEHPTRGLLTPCAFLPVAEETGLIRPIGAWVLNEACQQCRKWHLQGFPLSVAINLSARQFRQTELVDIVRQALRAAELSGEHLELELTESLLVEPTEEVIGVLRSLRNEGVRLAVDDFGTGYSSLGYLKRFPINTLKIAQPFVDEVARHDDDRAIVEAVVALARALRLQTIAEGVENEHQAMVIRTIGADQLQGFLFGKPVPPDDLSLAPLGCGPKRVDFERPH